MGPEGGRHGGQLVIAGTPEELKKAQLGNTAKFL
jgi:excinuclease UvrABC ATPase subunit